MPLETQIGDGADALGQNQLSDALAGTYWVSGWDATLGTGDLEVDIAAGDGAVDGANVSTGSTQTIDFTGDPDPDDPRKAVIYVDSGGTVQKSLGTPQPVDPSGEVRFRTYNPSPPANVSGVVVAEVWLAAGETVLESADIRDRRVANQAASSLGGFGLSASGYSDETANRSLETEYQNTTGTPLEVSVMVDALSDNVFAIAQAQVSPSSGGYTTADAVDDVRDPNADSGWRSTVRAIVPDGYYYRVNVANVEIERWTEQELSVE